MDAADDLAQAIGHLTDAFADGITVGQGSERATLSRRRIGNLIVPTGTIVACDPPTVEWDIMLFSLHLLPGRYPVILTIARFPTYDIERVAYAMLQVQDLQPVRWETAVLEGQNAGDNSYGVDTGTGCFMDVEAARAFQQRIQADPNFAMAHEEAIEQTWVESWGWAEVHLEPETTANMIAFSAGTGDGAYTTFVGYDSNDSVVCLITDFQVL